jgi:Ca2+-binding RTX toxin-like protein
LDGGPGRDFVEFYWANSGPVIANLTTGRATGAGFDQLIAVENLWGGMGDDVLIGDRRANRLIGGHEEGDGDVIYGRGGADVVGDALESGDDRLFGNGGNDRILAGPGDDRAQGGQGGDSILGGDGDDLLTGDRGDDRMRGGRGADAFHGGRGRDLCRGGPDVDRAAACERLFGLP